MSELESYFTENHVFVRQDERVPYFDDAAGNVLARIRGYVMVPRERIADMVAFEAALLPELPAGTRRVHCESLT